MKPVSVGDPYVPDSGNAGYRVGHYDLDLTYRVGSNRLEGTAVITAETTEELSRFSLDLAGLSVSKVAVDGREVKKFSTRGRKLQITLAQPVAAGAALTVRVRYAGNPKPVRGKWGEVGWDELQDGVIVASQPNGAPSWFPCNDHPSNKAGYRIAITADSPYRVVCNGSLARREVRASQTRWVYEQPEPMATYLATVQIGPYDIVDLAKRPVRQRAALTPRLAKRFAHDFARQPQMMALFEKRFGPYPYREYTVVVTEDELEIPLEAQGMSIFGANHLDGSRGSERLVAHELAHQWFGNSLTVQRWRHIWLHEGFACYAEWLWSEDSGGPSAQRMAARYWERLADSPQDLLLTDPGPDAMFDDRLYKRGALALHALRVGVGDHTFFETLRTWTSRYRHSSVTTEQFVACAEQVRGRPVDDLLTPWLDRLELPNLPGRR